MIIYFNFIKRVKKGREEQAPLFDPKFAVLGSTIWFLGVLLPPPPLFVLQPTDIEIPVLSFPDCAEFGLHGSVLTTDFIILFSFIITKNQCQPIKKCELSAFPSLLQISKLENDTTFYINQNNFSFRCCSNSYGSFLCYPLTLRCWVVHFHLQ